MDILSLKRAKESLFQIDFEKDYFQLSHDEIAQLKATAKEFGYRHNYNPNCCISRANQRAYYFYLKLQNVK